MKRNNHRRCPNRSGQCLDCPVRPGNDIVGFVNLSHITFLLKILK